MCQKRRHGISKGNHINYGLLSNHNRAPGRSLNLNLLMGKCLFLIFSKLMIKTYMYFSLFEYVYRTYCSKITILIFKN